MEHEQISRERGERKTVGGRAANKGWARKDAASEKGDGEAAAVRRNGADLRPSRRLLVYLRDEGGVFPLSSCLRSWLTVSLST